MSDSNQPPTPPTPSPTPTPTKEPTEWDYANKLEKLIPPTKTVGTRWFSYNDVVWEELDPAIYRPKAHAVFATRKRSERRAATLLKHLESRWQDRESIFKGAICFQEDGAILLNTLNGVLEVRPDGITQAKHNAAHYFTRCIQAVYDPSATCPNYHFVLEQCLPDPQDRELFLLCLGNFLLPDCRFEVALVCYGEAGSGKSTLATPVSKLFGTADHGLMTRLTMSQLCDPNCYALAKLRYACVNLGTELQSIAVDESANFKTIVSGEPLEARPIYCPPFTMHTFCKLWFLANNLPRFKHGTDAELRRTRFLRFEFKTEKPDVMLKERVAQETQGVFNLMLSGLQRCLTIDKIPYGGAHSRAVHTRFQVSNDPIGTFVARHCHFDPNASVLKDSLQGSFDAYCEQHAVPKAVKDHFCKMLYERNPNVTDARVTRGGQRVWVISGLGLKSDAPEPVEHVDFFDPPIR
jgi:P4 family phage/plasmid primase-like protien